MTEMVRSSHGIDEADAAGRGGLLGNLLRLARPKQWSKSVFVLIGPFYALADMQQHWQAVVRGAIVASVAFALVSSACYVINDLCDAPRDRLHPRKRRRPIASGAITPAIARVYALVLVLVAAALLMALPADVRLWVALTLAAYGVNVTVYTLALKRVVMADVMCLAIGFVLRVGAGCAAVGVAPTSWLLNCTFFIAMFLAFGKRLGERHMLGTDVATVRDVQGVYTTEMLRMVVVVTGVATLATYAGYVESRAEDYTLGFNLLWLTILPATYALFRTMVLLEQGRYDDPTELATRDRPFQIAAALFALMTVALVLLVRADL